MTNAKITKLLKSTLIITCKNVKYFFYYWDSSTTIKSQLNIRLRRELKVKLGLIKKIMLIQNNKTQLIHINRLT